MIPSDGCSSEAGDLWSAWIREERFRGISCGKSALLEGLSDIRDQVLAAAGIVGPARVLDIGAGDGLLSCQLLLDTENDVRVSLLDTSGDALRRAGSIAARLGVAHRVTLIEADMTRMAIIPNGAYDYALSRASLLYADKTSALGEISRVLNDSGVYVGWEPINRHSAYVDYGNFRGYRLDGVDDCIEKLHAFERAQLPVPLKTSLEFDAFDLVAGLERSGFGDVRVDVRIETVTIRRDWRSMFNIVANPFILSLAGLCSDALTEPETERFRAALQTACAAQSVRRRYCHAFIVARKGVRERGKAR